MVTPPVIVLVTGSRTWADYPFIASTLEAVRLQVDRMLLIHGAAKEGGDFHADAWGRMRISDGDEGLTVRRWPAKWKEHGRAAGMIRNREMVDGGADLCLAFLCQCQIPTCKRMKPHGTHGTDDCLTYAQLRGIDTRVFRWEER